MEISKLSSAALVALALTGLGACSSDPAKPDDSAGAPQQTSSAETDSGLDSTATGTSTASSTTTGEFAQMETAEPATATDQSAGQSMDYERSQRK